MDQSEELLKSDNDRISDLPDSVLSYILSKLNMKDLVNTSLLSRKWQYLSRLRMDLIFDMPNMMPIDDEIKEFCLLPGMPKSTRMWHLEPTEQDDLLFKKVRSEFVTRVNQFIKNFQGERISLLRVKFPMRHTHKEDIDRWIGSAIAKGIEHVDLLFRHDYVGMAGQKTLYEFPHRILEDYDYSNIKCMYMQQCLLNPPAGFTGFKQLRKLVLEESTLEENLLSCLSSECFSLEELSFIRCHFMSVARITGSKLSHLVILNCHHPFGLEISALKLSSFEFCDFRWTISSFEAPQLSKFFLYPFCDNEVVPYAFRQFANLPQLETLVMYLCHSRISTPLKRFSPLRNLKQLELFITNPNVGGENKDHFWVLTFLMDCPCLQKLSLAIAYAKLLENQRQRREHGGFSHGELKCVELRGCVGNLYEIELASHFLRYANSLQQISFCPSNRCYVGGGQWFWRPNNPSWFPLGREVVRHVVQAENNGHRRIKLIFL